MKIDFIQTILIFLIIGIVVFIIYDLNSQAPEYESYDLCFEDKINNYCNDYNYDMYIYRCGNKVIENNDIIQIQMFCKLFK